MNLEQRVMDKIAEILRVDRGQITPDTRSENIAAWDSMGTMEILYALTTDFGVRMEPEDADHLQSVQAVTDLVRRRTEES